MNKLTEHHEQLLVMNFASQHPEISDFLFAIPNGGKRNPVVAMKLKAEGVKAGVPDLQIAKAKKGFHGLFIEMKAKKGTTSPQQKEWIARLNSEGYKAVVCHGHEEAIEVLKDYFDIL